jgi:hypothetical protein
MISTTMPLLTGTLQGGGQHGGGGGGGGCEKTTVAHNTAHTNNIFFKEFVFIGYEKYFKGSEINLTVYFLHYSFTCRYYLNNI